MLVPCIDVPVDLSGLTASNSLYHRKGRRVINEALRTPGRPPWMGSRRDWMSRLTRSYTLCIFSCVSTLF